VRISRSRSFSFTATFGKLCRRLRKAPLTAEHFLSWRIFLRNSKKSFFGYRARDGRIPWLSVGHRFCARGPLAPLSYGGKSICVAGESSRLRRQFAIAFRLHADLNRHKATTLVRPLWGAEMEDALFPIRHWKGGICVESKNLFGPRGEGRGDSRRIALGLTAWW
jgi:hypothetical protein